LNHNTNLPKRAADDDIAAYRTHPFTDRERQRIAAYLHGWDGAADRTT
jgi:hypothetical protein